MSSSSKFGAAAAAPPVFFCCFFFASRRKLSISKPSLGTHTDPVVPSFSRTPSLFTRPTLGFSWVLLGDPLRKPLSHDRIFSPRREQLERPATPLPSLRGLVSIKSFLFNYEAIRTEKSNLGNRLEPDHRWVLQTSFEQRIWDVANRNCSLKLPSFVWSSVVNQVQFGLMSRNSSEFDSFLNKIQW